MYLVVGRFNGKPCIWGRATWRHSWSGVLIYTLQVAIPSTSQARHASASGDRTRGPRDGIGERSLHNGAYRMGSNLEQSLLFLLEVPNFTYITVKADCEVGTVVSFQYPLLDATEGRVLVLKCSRDER